MGSLPPASPSVSRHGASLQVSTGTACNGQIGGGPETLFFLLLSDRVYDRREYQHDFAHRHATRVVARTAQPYDGIAAKMKRTWDWERYSSDWKEIFQLILLVLEKEGDQALLAASLATGVNSIH